MRRAAVVLRRHRRRRRRPARVQGSARGRHIAPRCCGWRGLPPPWRGADPRYRRSCAGAWRSRRGRGCGMLSSCLQRVSKRNGEVTDGRSRFRLTQGQGAVSGSRARRGSRQAKGSRRQASGTSRAGDAQEGQEGFQESDQARQESPRLHQGHTQILYETKQSRARRGQTGGDGQGVEKRTHPEEERERCRCEEILTPKDRSPKACPARAPARPSKSC